MVEDGQVCRLRRCLADGKTLQEAALRAGMDVNFAATSRGRATAVSGAFTVRLSVVAREQDRNGMGLCQCRSFSREHVAARLVVSISRSHRCCA